jgi:CDP-diacylglycerol--serine O-phosphatidyltransferase
MDFRKTFFVLPNLFTLASLFCGLYSIVLSARLGLEVGDDHELLYKASLAIVFGLFFDGADGRIARLTRTQSQLGLQLDSLADLVTFGVAPALLVYRWGLEALGHLGLAIAFLYVACGALRLARFNVLAIRAHGKPGKFFVGLPIPLAANLLVAMVLTNHAVGLSSAINHTAIAGIVAVLSYLMISRVRFRSMKNLHLSRRTMAAAAAVAVVALILAARINFPFVFLGLIGLFIVLGLAEEVVFYRRRRREERAELAAQAAEAEEAEVLAELGAQG